MNQLVCQAISQRRVVSFAYDGGTRVVEPHCHGISTAGNEVLRGFQVAGYSGSGNPIGWRLFQVSKIAGWHQTADTFIANRPGYNPRDRDMKTIHCCV